MTNIVTSVADPDVPRELGPIRTLVGRAALQLREWQLLWVVPVLAAVLLPLRGLLVASASSDVVDAGKLVGWWGVIDAAIPIAPFIVAGAIILDKVADWYQKFQTSLDIAAVRLEVQGAETTAALAVQSLTVLLGTAIRAATKSGAVHEALVEELAEILTSQAAKSIGPGTRATYFWLTLDEHNSRILGNPVHSIELGRQDKPSRAFSEHLQPGLSIWAMMDGADEEPVVRHFPEVIDDLVWENKNYKTFYSIPVKSQKTQFGMLSVNNSTDGSIAETQRFVILAMARAFALVLAADETNRTWLVPFPADDSGES